MGVRCLERQWLTSQGKTLSQAILLRNEFASFGAGSLLNHCCHQSAACCIKTSLMFWTANHNTAALALTCPFQMEGNLWEGQSCGQKTLGSQSPKELAKIDLSHFSAPILQVQGSQWRLQPNTPCAKSVTRSHLASCETVRKIFSAPYQILEFEFCVFGFYFLFSCGGVTCLYFIKGYFSYFNR